MSLLFKYKFDPLRSFQKVLHGPFSNTWSVLRFSRVEVFNNPLSHLKAKETTLNNSSIIYLKSKISFKSYNKAPLFIPAGFFLTGQQFSKFAFFLIPFLYRYNIFKKYPRFSKVTIGSLILIFISSILAGLEYSEYGNRWRFLVLDEKTFIELSKANLEEFKKSLPLNNSAISSKKFEETKEIFMKLLYSTGETKKFIADKEWELLISEEELFNALSFISGTIIVNKGVYDFVNNQDELAFIVAHEISHILFSHSAEYSVLSSISSAIILLLSSTVLTVSLMLPVFNDLLQPIIDTIVPGYFLMPYSRLQEFEADKAALYLMARSGFDPRKAPDLWRRLDKDEKKNLIDSPIQVDDNSRQNLPKPSKYSFSEVHLHQKLQKISNQTHPELLNRADFLEAMMPDVVPIYLDCVKKADVNLSYQKNFIFKLLDRFGIFFKIQPLELKTTSSESWLPLYKEQSWKKIYNKERS